MDKVQKPRNSEYYTPSSEPFRIYVKQCVRTSFLCPVFSDWNSVRGVPRHFGWIPHLYFGRTWSSNVTFAQGSEGVLQLQVSREKDWQDRASHLASSLVWHHSINLRGGGGGCTSTLATTMSQLAGRIRTAVATVTPDLLSRVITENEYNCDICGASEGALSGHQ
jgi:hypothetical protein